ncbi:uncharacterized protein LOC143026880 [Oratosquilla oratoria]|uniref:uncharacterized protein LOC143026880 n=1 Tax=Oratosquilla oratoria TaxID=337810 RepID=UPI003F76155D
MEDERVVRCDWEDVPELPSASFSEYLIDALKRGGDNIALIDYVSGEEVTYKQLLEDVSNLTEGLVASDLRKGGVVCLVGPNTLLTPTIIISVVSAGATLTLANPLYTTEELERHLKDSRSEWIVAHPAFLANVSKAAKPLGIKVFALARPDDVAADAEFPSFFSLSRPAPEGWAPVPIEPDDVILLPYSSGTTGLPKGVQVTSRNWVFALTVLEHKNYFKMVSEKDVLLVVLPMFHAFGIGVVFATISQQAKLVVLPRFIPEHFLDAIAKHKVTILPLVPPIVIFLAKDPRVAKYDLSSLRLIMCGAASLSAQIQKAIADKMGLIVRQGYGMTESTLGTHLSDPDSTDSGAIGKVVGYFECKIISIETGDSLGPNEHGELCVKGPGVMKGYLGNPGATAATIDEEGWLHTGDIGYYDSRKVFYIVDRLKELVKYKGFQVAPAELEGLLLTHPCVKDAALVGLPDEEAGELPFAFVVKQEEAQIDEDGIKEWVAERVAPHKKLRGGVRFVESIPKSPSGKILRRVLRDQL